NFKTEWTLKSFALIFPLEVFLFLPYGKFPGNNKFLLTLQGHLIFLHHSNRQNKAEKYNGHHYQNIL
ncbi:MAG TPA: hypothetical protein VHO70_10930, partial [Chitinispirillaceae bacterium]|nr:hypothetical protein [Chitinispirillaceae bacterium]